MNPVARDVTLAILTRARERAVGLNKTKLLKLLYLADIEHYRKHNETLTGFDWIFLWYGPWAAEYDGLLDDLARTDSIEIEPWDKDELTGFRIQLSEPRDLNAIIADVDEYYRILRAIDTWADRSLPDLLNYVYFETEPMIGAVSREPLLFDNISKEPPKLYRRSASGTDPKALNRLRAKLRKYQEEVEAKRTSALAEFRAPVYDDIYASALNALDAEETH
jgi:antitoxin SocA-like protein